MFLLIFLITIISIFLIIWNLKIKIIIKDCNFRVQNFDIEKNGNFKIILQIYLFSKIKIFSKQIHKKINLKNFKKSTKNKIQNNKLKIKNKRIILKYIEDLNIIIEKCDFKMCFGTENAMTVAIFVGSLYAIFGNIVNNKIIKFLNTNYNIMPIYNKNLLQINFECIISVNFRNIIITIFKILLNKEAFYGRTSYRKSYVYSNE